MPEAPPAKSIPAAASAVSGHFDTRTAAMEIAEKLQDGMAGGCDLLLMFASFHHLAAFAEAAASIRSTLAPTVMLGVTGESVLGGDEEREGVAGLAALALRLPGVVLHPFTFTPEDPLPAPRESPDDPRVAAAAAEALASRIGFTDAHRLTLLLADPFTVPTSRIIPAIAAAGDGRPVRVAGGLASGASQPGYNRLLCNDHLADRGGVGVSLSNAHTRGGVDVDFLVSQGCRPIGTHHVITRSDQHIILELGGRPALEVLRETAEQMPDEEKQLLTNGLLIGAVINEYKDHFGRGDFLVRSVLGYDEKKGGILAGEQSSVGQTVQFHVRDARTASEDLELLLDAQQLDAPPFGALLFTCNGRGKRLFQEPDHDLNMIHQRLGNVPTAGFFCAGEIGPIGDRSFIHGHTASVVLFRKRD